MSNGKVDAFMAFATDRIAGQGVTRPALAAVLEELVALAGEREIWSGAHYAAPEGDERQARHLICADAATGFTLYLNVMRPGKRIPPHNHTTWACIAAVEGAEHNTLYERIDGGSGPGAARLRVLEEIELRPEHGVALMPEDIHSVEIRGEDVIRHLHFYGRALETLSERLTFDMAAGTASIMGLGVQTRSASKA